MNVLEAFIMNSKLKIILCVIIVLFIVAIALLFYNAGYKAGQTPEEDSNQQILTSDSASEPQSEPESEEAEPKPADPVEMLVNDSNPIPDDWEVDLVELKNGHKVDRRAYDSLQKMFDDARANGYEPFICSSYRTNEKQTTLFNNKVDKYKAQGMSEADAIAAARKWVAYPGTSEHQTGLALDIVTVENQNLDESQLNSECQLWLMEHCYDYGFILRYPEDKKELTGIDFEPWHYRYVGYDAAQIIKEKGICLEEYAALSNS